MAVGIMAAAIAITRVTRPLSWRAPFAVMFLAVYLATRVGGRRTGWLAVALGALGSGIANPDPAGVPLLLSEMGVFVMVGLAVVHLVAVRDSASRALQAREAQIRGALTAIDDLTARCQAETDLRASEQKLRQAQKMEAVGQLVAGVAHNFNNLLTITMGYTEILLERHGTDEDRPELDQIRQATARAAALTRQLLAFSRQKDTTPAPIDLNLALADLRPILTSAIREDIQLTIQTAATPATVLIDLQDFEQVILNLVINARDALPAGGTIEITVESRLLSEADSPSDLSPGEYVCLDVRDNGVGMTPDVQAHLFEPFFTTKEAGGGTGLGLASAYGTVRHHRGFVKVASAPGKGTALTLFFPRATAGVTSELSLAGAPVVR